MKTLIILLFTFCFFQTQAMDFSPFKVIGKNDLITVNANGTNLPLKLQNKINLDAIGVMDNGCTVTHIGQGYVITAAHCLTLTDQKIENKPCEDQIEWGFREGRETTEFSNCETIISAQRLGNIDYALLKVSPAPSAFIPIVMNRLVLLFTRELTLFSHPLDLEITMSKPLMWSQNCKVEAKSYEQLEQPEGSLFYKCDTEIGSSGAALISIFSKKIIGIHAGGKLLPDSTDGMNYGTSIFNTPIPEILKNLGYRP